MFREDVIYLIAAFLLFFFQLQFIKRKLPDPDLTQTEIPGKYTLLDLVKFHYLQNLLILIFLLQLSLTFLEIENFPVTAIYLVGFSLMGSGLLIYFLALQTLGTNWSPMHQYRIRKGQKLITGGIYGLIRHPIYLAVILEIVGFELVARSWLFIILGVVSFYIFYLHIKKEEELLKTKFGSEFSNYQKRTKMLIPYIF